MPIFRRCFSCQQNALPTRTSVVHFRNTENASTIGWPRVAESRPFAARTSICKDIGYPSVGRPLMSTKSDAANAPILLRLTAIFRDLSDDQLAEIRSRVNTHTLLRGEVLFREGAPSNSVYVVLS